MKKIVNGDTVSIDYVGMLEDGEVIENSSDSGPAEIEVGSGIMPPGFETALIGMSEGEGKTITLEPAEAFGHKDDKLFHTVNRSVFGEDIEPKAGMVLGMTVEKEGEPHKVPALVTAVDGEQVTLDFNHPLAEKTISYKITVKEIM